MEVLLMAAVGLLGFSNGANDNFKGVATLWGAGRATYARALVWATAFTFLGSVLAVWLASGLVAKFNGSQLLAGQAYTQAEFLAAVALGAAATVLLASRLGLPISTTHTLAGSLVGAGVVAAGFAQVKFGTLGAGVAAAGFAQVKFGALGAGVAAPLLFSPLVSLGLTLGLYPLVLRVTELAGEKDCVCVDEPAVLVAASCAASTAIAAPSVRWARAEECQTGAEVVRLAPSDALHWLSAAAISFARGLNDTPKIAALLLVAGAGAVKPSYALVALAMAAGGALGAARVAQTMSRKITPMANREAVTANLVAASLITLASAAALPVSTTHVTSGSIFGIGLLRRQEADWRRVREIVLSWVATLPLGAALAALAYWLLKV
jgi:PiT family inorganic phosphate transporter